MEPGPSHSNQRRLLHQGVGPQRVGSHNHVIENTTAKLMLELQGLQGNPAALVQAAFGRLVLEVTYGTEIAKTTAEQLASFNVEAMKLINDSFFELWLVDFFHSRECL